MKKIFTTIWAVWGALWFIITLIIEIIFLIPGFLMKDPASTKWFHKTSRLWMNFFLGGVGCPVTVKGAENFKEGTNYIVVANHNSFFDIFAVTPYLPNANKSIAKASLAKIPVFNWVYGQGSVLVDRNNAASRADSFTEMKNVLEKLKLDMVIYPEGTRNKTDKPLKDFYNGAFRLAADTQKNIIPVVIFNTRKILPSGRFALEPHRIYLEILPEISVEGKNHKQLKEEAFQKMWDCYEANEKKYA